MPRLPFVGEGMKGSRFLRSRAFWAAVLLILLPMPASAGGFCDSIKAIAAETPNGYASFRGALTRREDLYDHYVASGWPVGALSCEIEVATDENIPNQTAYTDYTCNFPLSAASKPAAMRTFTKSIQRCMSDLSVETGTKPTKDGGNLLLSSHRAALGFAVITMPENDMLRLNISNR